LIEVLLVIVIIGMLATVLIVTVGGTKDQAKIDLTRTQVDMLSSKIQQYKTVFKSYPETLEDLIQKPADEKVAEKWYKLISKRSQLNDQWENEMQYEVAGEGDALEGGVQFKVWSNGPDQASGTEDDISSVDDADA
jgi:general secretion pathway protein G